MKVNENYEKTGRMVPMYKKDFVRFVNQALDRYHNELKQGNPNPVPNPINDVLYITNDKDSTIMVPENIQSETIDIYMQDNPTLASFLSKSPSLIDHKSFELDDDDDDDDDDLYGDVTYQSRNIDKEMSYDDAKKQISALHKKQQSNSKTVSVVVICVLIVALVMYMNHNRKNK